MVVVGRDAQPVGVHLAQLGQALVPELAVPRVVIRVAAEHHLDVELGHGGDPAAEHLEQSHLRPLVIAHSARGLFDGEEARQLAPVPGRERRTRFRVIGHEGILTAT